MADNDPEVKFFRRTSTHVILDTIYSGKDSFEAIRDEMRARGHKRKDHDVKFMIRTLERVGLVEDHVPTEFGVKVKAFMSSLKQTQNNFSSESNSRNSIDDLLKITGAEILTEFYRKGFLLSSFLKALQNPGSNQMIAARFFKEANDDGFYNICAETDYNDFVPSMKNFAVYLGFAKRTQARGVVELTPIANEILNLESTTIVDRKKCDVEVCRKICPAGAIYCDYISGCVNCGLCARCCPYGAAQCDESHVTFDFVQCTNHPAQRASISCKLKPNLNEIIGSERTMQQWIVSLLKICKLSAMIPGPGSKPDIVLNREKNSAIIECKNEPIRGKKLGALQNQLEMYMETDVIQKTRDDLLNQWQFSMQEPDVFFICAPDGSSIDAILGFEGFTFPLGFVSTNVLFELHKQLLKRKEIQSTRILEAFSLKNTDISGELLKAIS